MNEPGKIIQMKNPTAIFFSPFFILRYLQVNTKPHMWSQKWKCLNSTWKKLKEKKYAKEKKVSSPKNELNVGTSVLGEPQPH